MNNLKYNNFILSSNPDHQVDVFGQFDFICEKLNNNKPVSFAELVDAINKEYDHRFGHRKVVHHFSSAFDPPSEEGILMGLQDLIEKGVVIVS